jgi:hypothetical protein
VAHDKSMSYSSHKWKGQIFLVGISRGADRIHGDVARQHLGNPRSPLAAKQVRRLFSKIRAGHLCSLTTQKAGQGSDECRSTLA